MEIIFILVSGLIYFDFIIQVLKFRILELHNLHDLSFVIASLSVLFLVYFCFYYFANWKRVSVRYLFLLILFFNIIFLFVPFLTSNDLYSYIFQTRIWPIFGKNPYLIPYDNFRNDVIYSSVKTIWSSQTVLQAPLFLIIGAIVNLIGKNNLMLLTLIFKLILIGANFFSAYFVYLITKNKKALFLYGLNPLVIFELAGNAHADSLLILFMLISLFLINRKPLKSVIAMTASVLVKYSTFILLPLEIVYVRKKGIKALFLMVIMILLITVVIFSPFWKDASIFNYLLAYYNGKYTSPSLGIALGELLLHSYDISFHLNTLLFLFFFIVLNLKIFFGKPKFNILVFYSFILYFVYLLTKLSLVLAWDLTPLLALASLCISWKKSRSYGVFAIIFVSLYSLAIYYFVR